MGTFLIYIVKSTFCLTLFYLGYKVLLSQETFFRFNRKVLLAGITICLLLPLIRIQTDTPALIQQPFMELERLISWEEQALAADAIDFVAEEEGRDSYSAIPSGLVLQGFYLLGALLTLVVMFRSFIGLCLLIRSGKRIQTDAYTLILLPGKISPFNWLHYIVLSETDYSDHPQEILTHELAHYRKRHSWDLFFLEVVILLHWFNPVAWLFKRELQEVHEYQADMAVLQSGIDATRYQLLLVKKAVGSSSYTFANSFNQSKLKKRITMMCKDQSNPWARWKSILFLPLAALALYAYASPAIDRQFQQFLPGEDTTIQEDTKKYTPEFFEFEMNKFLKQKGMDTSLSQRERYEKLMDHVQLSGLLVNSLGALMFDGHLIDQTTLATWVKKALTDEQNSKPLLIALQFDRDTPKKDVAWVYQTLGEVFTELKPVLEKRNQPIAVLTVDPINYGLSH